jgi:NAD(P)-dependent dehydrogenase (short-subunit alcohol dehydrogenase family)
MNKNQITFNFGRSRVLVTGGTSGIGEACALAFADAGADVMITGRNEHRASEIVRNRVSTATGAIHFVQGDVSDSDQCRNIVARAVEILGGLDIVVNSAGILYHATVEETTDEQWQQTMNVNVNGVFYICRAAIPHLKAAGGCIVNIASDAALTGNEHLTAYCASKGAVVQMSRAMALDYAADRIRIVPICPGDVDTPMLRQEYIDRGLDIEVGLRESAAAVPLNRISSAEEVAHMVLFAASDSAASITGSPLLMDGGYRA